MVQSVAVGVLRVAEGKEPKGPLLAQTERTAGKITQGHGLGRAGERKVRTLKWGRMASHTLYL